MKLALLSFLLILITPFINAQEDLKFDTTDLPGVNIEDHKEFTGSNLWGHINGGADLFLEYGFQFLDYYELEYDDINLRLEIYRFENKLEAFGIYSIKKFGCKYDFGKLKDMYCMTDYSLIYPEGKYYITIANNNGTDQEKALSIKLADIVSEKIKDRPLTFNDLYPAQDSSFEFRQTKLFKGPLGFQNGLPDWAGFFSGYENFTCIYYKIGYKDREFESFLFNFREESDLQQLLEDKSWELTNNELIIENEEGPNWLINILDKVLIIMTGNVDTDIMKEFRDLR